MLALVDAKRDKYLDVDVVDTLDLMELETNKWNRISGKGMQVGLSSCVRDGMSCKGK